MKVLVPIIAPSSFVRADISILETIGVVSTSPCRSARDILQTAVRAARTDVLYLWFGSVRFVPAAIVARLFGHRIAIVCGGYDVADEPAFAYGNMRGGLRRYLGRLLFTLADVTLPISDAAAREAFEHANANQARTRRLYLGVAIPQRTYRAPFSELPLRVFTLAFVNASSLRRKGIDRFARLSRLLPDVEFVIGGECTPDAERMIRSLGGPNLTLMGRVSDDQRAELFRSSRYYVQLSLHEAFGVAVAEAMAQGCIPVLTRAGSLPELGGRAAVYIDDNASDASVAQILRDALAKLPDLGEDPARRIETQFADRLRREQLCTIIDQLWRGQRD